MRNAGTNFHLKGWLNRSHVAKLFCTLKKKKNNKQKTKTKFHEIMNAALAEMHYNRKKTSEK